MAEKRKARQTNGSGSFRKRSDDSIEYRVSYGYNSSGLLIRKSFYGKTQAECRKKKKEYDKYHAVPLDKIYLVSEWAVRWLDLYKKEKCSIKMYEQYKHIIEKYININIGHLKLSSVKPAHIAAMMNKYTNKSESFVKKIMLTLRGIFETAIDNEFCNKNPAKNISPEYKKPEEREYFNEKELSIIEKFCVLERSNISDALIVLLYTGVRREELLGLKFGDICFEAGTIKINRAVTVDSSGKHLNEELKSESSYRVIPMFPEVREILETKPRISDFVFSKSNGDFQSPNGFSSIYSRLLKRINRANDSENQIRELSPHCCRHTFATHLSKNGVDIKIIQSILGHADISMTGNIYTHATIEGVKNAVKDVKLFTPIP